jgi:hypothetical protein
MQEPIFASQEHKAIIEKYIALCLQFVKDTASETKYKNFVEVLQTIVEYHNGYGKGIKENNFYDWLMIIPINLSVATNGFFAGIETKRNAAIVRAYKVVLEQAVHDIVEKIDMLEPKSE